MIYLMSVPTFIIAGLALAAIITAHADTCRDLSAQTYQEFKTGAKPVLPGRCPVPPPLQ